MSKQINYRHYKGGIYTYVCDATLVWYPNDINSHVIYKSKNDRTWVRPKSEFFGYTKNGGKRFTEIEQNYEME